MTRVGVFLKQYQADRQWDAAAMTRALATSGEQLRRVFAGEAFPPASQRRAWARELGFADLLEFDRQWRPRGVAVTRVSAEELIPVINKTPAGCPRDYEEYGLDSGVGYEYIPRRAGQEGPLFAVVVIGDSMAPTYHSGDVVVFRPALSDEIIPDGSPVFVRFGAGRDHACTFKRIYPAESGWLEFRPDNPRHASIHARLDEIDRLAIAVERRAALGDQPHERRCIADQYAQSAPEEEDNLWRKKI